MARNSQWDKTHLHMPIVNASRRLEIVMQSFGIERTRFVVGGCDEQRQILLLFNGTSAVKAGRL
jgi:hypothetical protein